MSRNVLIVLSNPIEGEDDAYNEWYNGQHLEEVVALPEIVSARRFRLSDDQGEGFPESPHRYVAIYELAGEPRAAIDRLRDEVDGGRIGFSAALDQDSVVAWAFEAVGELSSEADAGS